MNTLKEKVGDIEIIFLILGIKLGERLVSLPRTAIAMADYAGIVSVFLGGILALIVAHIFARLSLSFPDKTIMEYSQIILGKILGKIVILAFFMYFLIFGSLFIRRIPEFIKQVFLYSTPVEVIAITFILISAYCAVSGIAIYARVADILIGLGVIATIILLAMAIPFVNGEELLPAFQLYSLKKINIFNFGLQSYVGIEIIPFLVPFMRKPKNIKRNSNIALLIILVIYTTDVLVTTGVLGEAVLKYRNYPVFDLAKTIVFPGFFDIRADILFACLWILLIYIVMVGYHYLSSITLSSVIGIKSHGVFVILLMPIIYILSLLPQNFGEIDIVLRFLGQVWLYVIVGTILFMYIIGIARKKVKI